MDLKKAIEKKRKAFKEFDALPEKRQKELTAVGLNPHEPKATRELKKAAHCYCIGSYRHKTIRLKARTAADGVIDSAAAGVSRAKGFL